MRLVLALAFCSFVFKTHAQINPDDSTAQVVGFWDNGEKQSYNVSFEKMNIAGTDTTRELTTHDVDITIKDSTENSYTIEWIYKNSHTNSDNKALQKLVSMGDNMKILIKTDEFGAFQEVVNWMEIRDYVKSTLNALRKEFRTPQLNSLFDQVERQYSSKEVIESGAIRDVQQFYTFHGGKYKLNEEIKAHTKAPNTLGGEPFDSEITVSLDELNIQDNNFILRMSQIINSQQLTEASLKFLQDNAKKSGTAPPQKDLIRDLVNETVTASRIHESGWPLYTIQTITVGTGVVTNIQERIIQLKD